MVKRKPKQKTHVPAKLVRSRIADIEAMLRNGLTARAAAERLAAETGCPVTASTIHQVRWRLKKESAKSGMQPVIPAASPAPAARAAAREKPETEPNPDSKPRRVVWNPNPNPEDLL
jgi:hypothetical protein